ncbi:S-layer homology domain-containing protein [Paenibacillus chartarius]|uniref:S-layer homology domain-containing protein n=1 Tax=Paenibacillus chartarius TaxID=747481 RepID=A0ABV6DGM2_9BACL
MKLLKTLSALTLATTLFGAPLAMAEDTTAAGGTAASGGSERTSSAAAMPMPTDIPMPAPVDDEKSKAEAKITKEQAIDIAKKLVTIPEGYTIQNVNLSGRNYMIPNPSWNLNYVKKEGSQYLGNLSVQIDAVDGKLLGYSIYNSDPSYKPSYPPKVNFQAAKDVAAKWLGQINPEALAQTQYNDSNEKSSRPPLKGEVNYELKYERVVNGIVFPQNFVSVTVNGDGEVTQYQNVWNEELTFEDPKGIIDAAAAEKKVRELTEPELTYQIPYRSSTKKPLLAYTMGTYPISAKTGDVYVPEGSELDVKPNRTPLTEQPLAGAPAATLNLTKEEAIAKVTASFKLPEGMIEQESGYSENSDDITGKTMSTWNLRWSNRPKDASPKDGGPYKEIYATVNAKTGELINFNHFEPYSGEALAEVKVKQEDAKAKAVELVKSLMPAYTHQLVLENRIGGEVIPLDVVKRERGYTFMFSRYIDGVKAGYDSVSVTIDAVTGEARSFSGNFSQIDYPAQKPETIAADKAEELLLSNYELKLQYVNNIAMYPYMYAGGAYVDMIKLQAASGEPTPEQESKKAALVYALTPKYSYGPAFVLNAVTGGWVSPDSGEPVTLGKVQVTDIEGHWAQAELQLMLDYQALSVKDGKVSPDTSISKGELIKMLVISMNGGDYGIMYDTASRANSFADVKGESPYFQYVERAVDLGILDIKDGSTFNPEANVTREELSQLIVRALGYSKLAEKDGIFAKPFTDSASLKRPGEVAIVVGLGIMSASEAGSFLPAETVTKAQAATAFYRYLEARADLQGKRPIYY